MKNEKPEKTKSRGKKLVFFSSFFLSHIGGVERYVYELGRRLVERGYQVTVVSCRFGSEADEEVVGGIEVMRIPCFMLQQSHYPVPLIDKQFWRRFSARFPDGIDLIITQARFYLLSLFGARYAVKTKTPYIHTEHGSTHLASPKNYVNRIVKFHDHTIGKYILKHAQKVTVVSPSVIKFVNHLGRRDAQIIPNGVDTEFFTFKPKQKTSKLVVGYAGRLEFSKGPQDIIAALQMIQNPDLTLKIAGDGPHRDRLVELAKSDSRIEFIGSLDRDQMKDFYQTIDLLVFPSRQPEGLPTTILEAQAAGVLVAATKIGGVIDLVEDGKTGFLVESANPPALAELVQKVLDLPAMQKEEILTTSRRRVEEHFSWDQIADAFEATITEVIG